MWFFMVFVFDNMTIPQPGNEIEEMEHGLEEVLYKEHLDKKPSKVVECNFDWNLRRPKKTLMMLKKLYQTPSEDPTSTSID